MEVFHEHIRIKRKSNFNDNSSESTKESYKRPKKLKKLNKHIKSKQILSGHFNYFFTKNLSPPKKEYLRCKVIRSHKRALRQITTSACPIKIIIFNKENMKASNLWERFCEIYSENKILLREISQADLNSMPGREEIWKNHESAAKSFNSKFCKSYFSEMIVRESYHYFTELLFYDLNPEILRRKFDFSCCLKNIHSDSCVEAWRELKKYLQTEVLLDLNTLPWAPCLGSSEKSLQITRLQPDWINKIYIDRYFSSHNS